MFFAPAERAEELSNFVGYCLGHAANKFGIEVHACVFMSNHHHTDVTDPLGKLVEFKQLFHSMLARGINTMRGRFDGVWSRDKPCDTRRSLDDDSLADLVYTVTNPVKAGLVKWGRLWPGFTTHSWRFGETRRFERPAWFFDASGSMPDTVELMLRRPPIFPELNDEQLYELLMKTVRAAEKKTQGEMKNAGQRFKGLEKLQRQPWDCTPGSYEERFTRVPRLAGSKWLVLAELQRDRGWEQLYAMAREQLLAGLEAVFPSGTYWLRRFAGVSVTEFAPS